MVLASVSFATKASYCCLISSLEKSILPMIFPKSTSLLKIPISMIPSVKGLLMTVLLSFVGLLSSDELQLNRKNTDNKLIVIFFFIDTVFNKCCFSKKKETACVYRLIK